MHDHTIPASGDLVLLFFASLLGSAHCVGMCGPYVALCAARLSGGGGPGGAPSVLGRLVFNAGRLATYAGIGALAGGFGRIALAAGNRFRLEGLVALAAGVAAVLFGAALAGRLRDPSAVLEKLGFGPLIRGAAASALRAPPYASGLLLGALQGALPCALVYGAASRASVAGSAPAGATVMLVFGLGTVPAIFALSSVSPQLLRRLRAGRWSGFFVAAVGVLLILRGLAGLGLLGHTAFW